jgi:hypothetical protein
MRQPLLDHDRRARIIEHALLGSLIGAAALIAFASVL